jgi:hypothetical protein
MKRLLLFLFCVGNSLVTMGMDSSGKKIGSSPRGSSPSEKSKKGSGITKETAVELFSQKSFTEVELDEKLAKALKVNSRDEKEKKLLEILDTPMVDGSAAKHNAACALFDSYREIIDITMENIKVYNRDKMDKEKKAAFFELLKYYEAARLSISKKICADHPRRTTHWCNFDTYTHPDLVALTQKIMQLIAVSNVTHEMKEQAVLMSPKRPS